MKKLLLLLSCIVVALSHTANAQADFAPIGATWYYDHVSSNHNGYRLQHVVKDTLVHGKDCRQISLVSVDSTWSSGPGVDTNDMGRYFVYANADTVFYYNEYWEDFVPLYIFNVNIGDTLTYFQPIPSGSDSFFRFVVTDIQTSSAYGDPIRTIFTDAVDWYYVGEWSYTERLGFADGLDWHLWGHTSDYMATKLRCYTDDKIQYFREPGMACSPFGQILSVDELAADASINVYPNPAMGVLHINIDKPYGGKQSLRICDAQGREVYRQQDISGTQINVSTHDWSAGIYLLQLQTGAARIVKKIRIQ